MRRADAVSAWTQIVVDSVMIGWMLLTPFAGLTATKMPLIVCCGLLIMLFIRRWFGIPFWEGVEDIAK